VYERLEQMEGVDFVDDVDVVEIALREGVTDERARIGLEVGRSVVGTDSWLGARPEHGPERILVDAAGRMVGVALKPYELLRVTSGVEDFSTGEGGARRPRVERVRRAAAGPPGPARATSPEPGAPLVGGAARPSDSIARRPPERERPAVSDGAPGRLLAQLPGIYHGWPELSQLLSMFETILCVPHADSLETQIAQIATLLDVVREPRELPGWTSAEDPGVLSQRRDAFLPWLAQWVALSGAASLPLERQRRLVGRIVPLYSQRGTRQYLIDLLRFHLPERSEIDVEDQDFTGLILGKSRVGVDTWLEEDRPFWFKVTIRLPEGERARGRIDWPVRIRHVVDLAKPAHTTYDLEVAP
jgi:phage tail-like protein